MTIKQFQVVPIQGGMMYLGLGEDDEVYVYQMDGTGWKSVVELNDEAVAHKQKEEFKKSINPFRR